jgi:hypothetical protein
MRAFPHRNKLPVAFPARIFATGTACGVPLDMIGAVAHLLLVLGKDGREPPNFQNAVPSPSSHRRNPWLRLRDSSTILRMCSAEHFGVGHGLHKLKRRKLVGALGKCSTASDRR